MPLTLNLQWVDLSDCGRLNDAGLHLMAKNSPHLKHLYLRRCINITGKIYDDDPKDIRRKYLYGILSIDQD